MFSASLFSPKEKKASRKGTPERDLDCFFSAVGPVVKCTSVVGLLDGIHLVV